MSSNPEDISPSVLHIQRQSPPHQGAEEAPNGLIERLRESGVALGPCSDVYSGLARIGKAQAGSLLAVVVDLDAIDTADEMEFFALVGRVRREVEVYVYSRHPDDPLIQEALDRGAAGLLDDEALRRIVRSRAEQTCVQSVAAPITPESEAVPVKADHDLEVHEEWEALEAPPEVVEEQEAPDASDETSEAEVRVPWLRYDDRPLRQKPPSAPPSAPRLPINHRPLRLEPLLTPEEIQALLEDDEPSDAGDARKEISEPGSREAWP